MEGQKIFTPTNGEQKGNSSSKNHMGSAVAAKGKAEITTIHHFPTHATPIKFLAKTLYRTRNSQHYYSLYYSSKQI